MFLLKRGRWYYYNRRYSNQTVRIALRTTRRRTGQQRAIAIQNFINRLLRMGMTLSQIASKAVEVAKRWINDFETGLMTGEISAEQGQIEIDYSKEVVADTFGYDDYATNQKVLQQLSDDKKVHTAAHQHFATEATKVLNDYHYEYNVESMAKALLAAASTGKTSHDEPPADLLSNYIEPYFEATEPVGSPSPDFS